MSRWGISLTCKGLYEFTFSNSEDVRRVRSVVSWNLNPSLLKLFAWSREFNPTIQQRSTSQVWVKIYGISQEYWRPKIIFSIASNFGTPTCTYDATTRSKFDRTFGQYVRVLVDMDLQQRLCYKILVDKKGFTFYVELKYENLPYYCTQCNIIGHYLDNYKKVNKQVDDETDKEPIVKK